MSDSDQKTPEQASTTETESAGPKVVEIPKRISKDTAVNPAKGPPFQIQSNTAQYLHLKALIYADYGTGKTFLVGTSAEIPYMRDVLLISAEAGELTLHDPDSPYNFNLIDVVHVFDYKTLARVQEFLKLHCSVRDAAAKGDKEAQQNLFRLQKTLMPDIPDPERLRLYRTVILDSLTEAENMCLQQLIGAGSESLIDEDISSIGWDEYRTQRMMIHRLIRSFRNLPMSALFTCPKHFRKTDTKPPREIYMPMMTGKLSKEVQGFVDLVGHYVSGDIQTDELSEEERKQGIIPEVSIPRRLYIQPTRQFDAKSRFTRYKKPYFENPTMKSITQDVGLYQQWERVYGPNPNPGLENQDE